MTCIEDAALIQVSMRRMGLGGAAWNDVGMATRWGSERPPRPVFAGRDLIVEAAVEAGELLADLPDRWQHTQEVALHAWWASAGLSSQDRDLLVAAAYLHDIGYAPHLKATGFHPVDGARHLEHTGRPALARLVAHHSGASVEARYRDSAGRWPSSRPVLVTSRTP